MPQKESLHLPLHLKLRGTELDPRTMPEKVACLFFLGVAWAGILIGGAAVTFPILPPAQGLLVGILGLLLCIGSGYAALAPTRSERIEKAAHDAMKREAKSQ